MTGFVKAEKTQARARVAFSGPAGAGKTFTALTWARALGDRIAVIDTERNSALLYADDFDFDHQALNPPYHPERLIRPLEEAAGYDVVIVDSLSHFWSGEGGVLEIVDHAKSGSDSWRAWSKGTPVQQRMVDLMLRHPAHLLATIRSKTEYALTRGADGKNAVEKLGMKPIQRDEIDYEFTVMVDIDSRHIAHVTKTRFGGLADRDVPPEDTVEVAAEFAAWLKSGTPLPDAASPVALREFAERLAGLSADVQGTVRAAWPAGIPKLREVTAAADLAKLEAVVERVLAGPTDNDPWREPAPDTPHDDPAPHHEGSTP